MVARQTVYLVNEEVDLGYHVVGIYRDKGKADSICAERNKEYFSLYSGSGKTEWFFVEEHIVEEHIVE